MITCLWFERGQAREAAEFYANVFPDSRVGEAHACTVDIPSAKVGEDLTVEFTVLGRAYIGLNGGPNFRPNEAVSFMVLPETQEETDRYWDAIVGNGGQESACGWCKDRWGFSWQFTPRSARRDDRPGSRRRGAGHGSDDDDEEDRHRDDRGRAGEKSEQKDLL
jgi:predicted 3-demethylubiquinone-9 3-methyltransferase (glyoxalase superfamily)